MKKYIPILILSVLIVPSVAFASWWNPISWFNGWTFRAKQVAPIEQVVQQNNSEDIEALKAQIKKLEEKQNITVPKTVTTKITAPTISTPVVDTVQQGSQIKQQKLNEISKQIADLNAEYAQRINDVSKEGGQSLEQLEAEKRAIGTKYLNDYNLLVAKYQQIQYSN